MSRASLTELLRLTSAPVAISFVDAPPPGSVLHGGRRSQTVPGGGAHAQRDAFSG